MRSPDWTLGPPGPHPGLNTCSSKGHQSLWTQRQQQRQKEVRAVLRQRWGGGVCEGSRLTLHLECYGTFSYEWWGWALLHVNPASQPASLHGPAGRDCRNLPGRHMLQAGPPFPWCTGASQTSNRRLRAPRFPKDSWQPSFLFLLKSNGEK